MALIFKDLDYVKVVGANGDFRYGCVQEVKDHSWVIEISFNDEGLNKISYENAAGGATADDYTQSLTPTERTMIPLLAGGLKTADIAEALSISPVTARGYIRLLRIKLQLDDRAQLMAFAQGLCKTWGG